MEILTKAEPEDSDTPPTPPPHDEQLDTSSPASSECSDEELPYDDDSNGDETTESETLDTVASVIGGANRGVRQRRAKELSERVATMKKRQHEADRWQFVKRSLYMPLAFSVGFITVTGVLIYAFSKQ